MANETVFVMSGPGLPPYSSRGITQTLEPIEAAGVFARTVNGKLINLAPAQFALFRTTVSCKDVEAPAFNGLKKGDHITMDCAVELGYHTGSDSPSRPVVAGSSRVVGNYTYYRPEITVVITNWTCSRDEYGHITEYQFEGEEFEYVSSSG